MFVFQEICRSPGSADAPLDLSLYGSTSLPATRAKNLLGQVIDDACIDMVMLERHGKEQVALMPAAEARMGVLCSYAAGVLPRSTAMKRLGLTWYGQLVDTMAAAGLHVQTSAAKDHAMTVEVEQLLGRPNHGRG